MGRQSRHSSRRDCYDATQSRHMPDPLRATEASLSRTSPINHINAHACDSFMSRAKQTGATFVSVYFLIFLENRIKIPAIPLNYWDARFPMVFPNLGEPNQCMYRLWLCGDARFPMVFPNLGESNQCMYSTRRLWLWLCQRPPAHGSGWCPRRPSTH
jgi:hypothetical protein